MVAREIMVGVMVALALLGAGVAVAPTATATHSCGFEPCPHPQDIFCLTIVKKFFPQFCPYG